MLVLVSEPVLKAVAAVSADAAGLAPSAGPDAPPPPSLQVGGFTPLSTSDWPERLAAVVFVTGCPWRCAYCHNPDLLTRRPAGAAVPVGLAWPDLLVRLQRRRGLLDGVVFSGGEPTLDPGLADAVQSVKAAGLAVGLHTGGASPRRLAGLLPDLDWVGLDLKTDPDDYERVTGTARSGHAAWDSLELLLAAGTPHELRTTFHPPTVTWPALLRLAERLERRGVTRWVLQRCFVRRADGMGQRWREPDGAQWEALRARVPQVVWR